MPAPPDDPRTTRRRWLRSVGFAVGVLLLAAAVVMVWRQRGTLGDALSAIRHPDPWPATLLIAAIVANVVLTAQMLWLLINRYGRVGWLEMQTLIATTTLLNFLPLRPGLVGRITYHRVANAIAPADTVRTMVHAAVISATIAGYLAAVAVVSGGGAGGAGSLWWGVAAPVPILLAGCLSRRRVWFAAVSIRYLEVLVWAVRYHAAFALIGSPIDATAAVGFACVSVIATMVPFVSNGLGLREWAIGLLAPILTREALTLELGVTADLVNRGAELVVITILGLIGALYLVRGRGVKGWRGGGVKG